MNFFDLCHLPVRFCLRSRRESTVSALVLHKVVFPGLVLLVAIGIGDDFTGRECDDTARVGEQELVDTNTNVTSDMDNIEQKGI